MIALFKPGPLYKKGKSLTQTVLEQLGYECTTNAEHYEFALHWNFSDTNTPVVSRPAINYRCNNVLKDHVDHEHTKIFGYSSRKDTNDIGIAVKKSLHQCAKSFEVVQLPCKKEDGFFYQRFINNRISVDWVRDYRFYFAFDEFIIATRDKEISGTFVPGNALFRVTLVKDIEKHFTKGELEKIKNVIYNLGLDVGGVDVLRDYSDNRIFVVDINNIPGVSVRDTPEVIKAFKDLLNKKLTAWLNR